MKSITIPEQVTSMGYNAFGDCTTLKEVKWNAINCVTGEIYRRDVFRGCDQLTTVTIGFTVEHLPDELFDSCVALQTVDMSRTIRLESIGSCTFSGCSSLKKMTIPSSVTSIGERAFENCSALAEVQFENPWYWKANGVSLTLTDVAQNAILLTQTYFRYTWTRL